MPLKGQKHPNPGGGRPRGSLNKVTKDVRALAQQYGPDSIRGLAVLAGLTSPAKGSLEKRSENAQVRKAAMDSLLDRAYGKPSQPVEGSGEGTIVMGLIVIPPKDQ